MIAAQRPHRARRPWPAWTSNGSAEALRYLEALGTWRDRRKVELDQLDQAALAASEPSGFTEDLLLSMVLWKAVADRLDLLVATWDSGRVGQTELERLTTLVWGRLDTTRHLARSEDETASQMPLAHSPFRCPRPVGSPTPWRPRCARASASTRPRPTPTLACVSSVLRWSACETSSTANPRRPTRVSG